MTTTPDSSSGNFAEITPVDADLPSQTRYLIVEQAGDLVCHNQQGDVVTVPVGAGHIAVRTKRILPTSTVGRIVAFY